MFSSMNSSKSTALLKNTEIDNLSIINEEEEDADIRTSTQQNFKPTILESPYSKNQNGLDKFMKFLDHAVEPPQLSRVSQHSNQKQKTLSQDDLQSPLSFKNKIKNKQKLNKQRPKSSNYKNGLNDFMNFLQTQDITKKKTKKKQEKTDAFSKFMQTLTIAETVKQEKKLNNIVSGILVLTQGLIQHSKTAYQHRFLINQSKFAQIKPKNNLKAVKLKVRCHTAKNLSKVIKIQNIEGSKSQGRKEVVNLEFPHDKNLKAIQRKIKFFENINNEELLRINPIKTPQKRK